MKAWLLAFLFTQAVEAPLYRRVTSWRVALLASTFTHPFVWFAFPRLPLPYWWMVGVAETFAVLVEAAWLRFNGVRHALVLSFLVNAASVALGLLSRHLFGVP